MILFFAIYVVFALIFAKTFDIFKDCRGKYEIMGCTHYCLFWPYYSWAALKYYLENKK